MSRNVYELPRVGFFSKIFGSFCCCGSNEEASQPLNENQKSYNDSQMNSNEDTFPAFWGS